MNINWLAYKFLPFDGYGRYGMSIIRALVQKGIGVRPGTTDELIDMPDWMQMLAGWNWTNLTIQCLPGHCLISRPGRQWIWTMTEDSSVPKQWVEMINSNAAALIVPCEHNKLAFEEQGVKLNGNVYVVPGGCDPLEFPLQDRLTFDRPYTFLALADRVYRKGTDVVFSAFYKAFGDAKQTPDVRLVFKGRPAFMSFMSTFHFTDPRLSMWVSEEGSMADIFANIDCFVFPSFGEGWGLPPREAALMGKPVIATNYSGLAEGGLENWAIPINDYIMRESALTDHPGGMWAVPSVDAVAEQMRWCYENRDKAHEKGVAGAAWLRANQTWDHVADRLIRLIQERP
ncbi:MAG: glycosyltransferase family 4 protein [Anaerolineae bacterium]|nr:glycosyltransferase family 4 protein [Anaerolineae bacterium]